MSKTGTASEIMKGDTGPSCLHTAGAVRVVLAVGSGTVFVTPRTHRHAYRLPFDVNVDEQDPQMLFSVV